MVILSNALLVASLAWRSDFFGQYGALYDGSRLGSLQELICDHKLQCYETGRTAVSSTNHQITHNGVQICVSE